MTVQLIQFCPGSLLWGILDTVTNGYQFYRKTFLRSVSNQKMSHFHFDLSLELSQGEVHDFSGEMQKFPGGTKRSHLPSKSDHA
jgi:hypothetical protein